MMKWPYIQSSAMDVSTAGARKALERFKALDVELATIGAKRKPIVMMVHDEAEIEIDCPKGREREAMAILRKHFPQDLP